MAFDTGSCFKKNEQIIYKELGGEPVLIDPYRRTLVKLNTTARLIWQLIDGKHSAEDIAGALENEFEIGRNTLEEDVKESLRELFLREMIQ